MSFLLPRLRSPLLTPLIRYSSTSSSTPTASSSTVVAASSSGSEITEVNKESNLPQAGVVSGVPDEIHRRPVRIYSPAVSTTQSAKGNSHHWRIDWDILAGGGRWENPLMGWASSADYMQATHVKFNTKEAAIHFCEKQGFSYFVQEPQKTKFKAKNYSSNYAYTSKPLRLVVTK